MSTIKLIDKLRADLHEAQTKLSAERGKNRGLAEQWRAARTERDALAAELAAIKAQEPVARVGMVPGTDFKSVDFFPDLQSLPVGATLYMLPPLAGQVSVPRELLAKLVEEGRIGEVADDEWSLLNALLATPSMEVNHGQH